MTARHPQPAVLYAEFTAAPGNEERVAELVQEYGALVRGEPGNLVFAAHRKRADPASFFVYEEYVDEDAFAHHLGAEYGRDFNLALAGLIVGVGSQLTFLEPVSL